METLIDLLFVILLIIASASTALLVAELRGMIRP